MLQGDRLEEIDVFASSEARKKSFEFNGCVEYEFFICHYLLTTCSFVRNYSNLHNNRKILCCYALLVVLSLKTEV